MNARAVAEQAVAQLRALQHVSELEQLLQLVAESAPAVVVEIGTRTGATLWAFAQASPDATLVSIDPTNERRFLHELIGPDRDLHLITGRSQDTATLIELERILDGRPIGFLHIDGDHTLQAVERDVELYGPLVDGFVALHDIATYAPHLKCAVDVVWSRLRQLPGAFEILDETVEPLYGIGILPLRRHATSDASLPAVMAHAHAEWARRRYQPGHPLHPDTSAG